MDKPSAAIVARSFELSMIALEAIASVADPLNQSPEKPDQLFAHHEPARNCRSGRFPRARASTFTESPDEIRLGHL